MTSFVRHLAAPTPGWTISADVLVVGSGIAGLTAALELRTKVDRVLVVTKGVLSSGSTVWAQGGIAAALDPEDTPEEHLEDTLVAGAGLCSPEAVRALVTEGPDRVRDLVTRGAHFDTGPDGGITLSREGGHHRDRIAHAGGDATGAEISRALVAQARGRAKRSRHRGHRARDGGGPPDRRARCRRPSRPRVRRHAAHHRRRFPRRRRRRLGQVGDHGHRRHRPGVPLLHQPREAPRATAWQARCAPAPRWPISSSSNSTPRSCGRVPALAASSR
ncbi:FAD-dependent oxidoreductase [Demequina litorisediminis]|uniref:FAD-dependent oxidoreductase n=1 Tax=Demequina litorisediminis TaxID=1849022 RepID=UPI003D67D114